MKKIIPFNNVLDFNTDVKEITAISLEHEIKKYPDMISGIFYISGEYKITEGLLEREKFNFELPFEIALANNYDLDSLLVDIDDFRYELISDKSLKINIDLYIDGEEIEIPKPREVQAEEIISEKNDIRKITNEPLSSGIVEEQEESFDKESLKGQSTKESFQSDKPNENPDTSLEEPETAKKLETTEEGEPIDDKMSNLEEIIANNNYTGPERIDLLSDMLTNDKENNMNEDLLNINIDSNNENINNQVNENTDTNNELNFFSPNSEEKYVTYRVYKVLENDTIDSILTKYNVTKEMLADYNNIENINTGDKLIIPTNEE